ncbi:hypothetical protein vseg_018444 [Gypsophila vaccaria]
MEEESTRVGHVQDDDGGTTLETGSVREEPPVHNILSVGRKEFVAPAVGLEFESYNDAYDYYNCYAKEAGFRVRVKNSWFKRNSKEKYGAVLCCSSQGFKRIKDVNRLRKETRTGCEAMVRVRLVDSKRWRIVEVVPDHNHSMGLKRCKSMKVDIGAKRMCGSKSNSEGQTLKLYRALVIDNIDNENLNYTTEAAQSVPHHSFRLNLKKSDAQAIYNYVCRMQLTNANFFYLMDFNDDGYLKHVMWVDARSRAACVYFGGVVFLDNTYLVNKYELPLVAFVGVNHHGQSVLLGCGLLASETTESYLWLLRTWAKCMSGHVPQTVITNRCEALKSATAEVFPRSHHRYCISHIMRKVPEKLGGLRNYDVVRKAFTKAVYETLKVNEFETAWRFMVQNYGVANHEWLQSLYEDRAHWVPVYVKDSFFAGMSATRPAEQRHPFFEKYVLKQTSVKEFLDKYELALQRKHKEETLSDIDSRTSTPVLKTRCPFEQQLSKVYTKKIFQKFQVEVEEMYSCFSTTKVHVDGPYTIFLVKERVSGENNTREIRDVAVYYNTRSAEVQCICGCFNFNGYLCRHALCVLNFNGLEEIPTTYILSRWKKDCKRVYVADQANCSVTDHSNQIQWFNQLYRSALRVVEEGGMSLDHYKSALQAFDESLNRVHSVEEKHE